MQLPKVYRIKEQHGIDYTVFRIENEWSATSDTLNAFIMFGCCVGTIGQFLENVKAIDSTQHSMLNVNVMWKIYDLDSLYLAETLVTINEEEKAVVGIKSKNREQMNELITSFGTLRKK